VSITDRTLTDLTNELADLAADLDQIIQSVATNHNLALDTALTELEQAVNTTLTVTHVTTAVYLFEREIIFWCRERDRAAQRMAVVAGNPRHGAKAEMGRAQHLFEQACDQITELEAAKADMLAGNDDLGEVA
jgi:hypothetical protein